MHNGRFATIEDVVEFYITSAEGHSGKSAIALGVLETLQRGVGRVGVFRPVARSTSERDFVLGPWLAVDPDAVLPGVGRVDEALRRLRGDR